MPAVIFNDLLRLRALHLNVEIGENLAAIRLQAEVGLQVGRKSDVDVAVQRAEGHGLLRSEEHTSELQSRVDLVCRLLLEKKKQKNRQERDSRLKSCNI